MKNVHKFLTIALAAMTLLPVAASAQNTQTFSGNGSSGFGGPLGGSSLTVSDNASTGVISFALTTGNSGGFDDVAFYFSTADTTNTVTDTSGITDTGDSGRRAISGLGTSDGRTLVQFASGFATKYAVSLDSAGNANLFQIVPGQGYLTYVSGANYTNTGHTYGFSLTEAQLGLTAGSSFNFVATLSNPSSDTSNVYRSNETIGASNVDNNSQGNLGFTGTLIYSGFDTFATAVPEPATWLAGGLLLVAAGWMVSRSRRSAI